MAIGSIYRGSWLDISWQLVRNIVAVATRHQGERPAGRMGRASLTGNQPAKHESPKKAAPPAVFDDSSKKKCFHRGW